MTLTLLTGFSAIGGILAGYLTARLAPIWALWLLWGAALVGSVLFYLIGPAFLVMDPFVVVIIVMGVLMPFTGSALLAGGLGLIVRRFIVKDPAR